MSALEVSPFHGIALYKSTFAYLLICVVNLFVVAGCEYGDMDSNCASAIERRECYDMENRRRCCSTCATFRIRDAPAGCEFGDKAAWCAPNRLARYQCYQPSASDTCCRTCATYHTGPSGRNASGDWESIVMVVIIIV